MRERLGWVEEEDDRRGRLRWVGRARVVLLDGVEGEDELEEVRGCWRDFA